MFGQENAEDMEIMTNINGRLRIMSKDFGAI